MTPGPVHEAVRRAHSRGTAAFLTFEAPVGPPEALFRGQDRGPAFLWAPTGGPTFAGRGVAWRAPLRGPERFKQLGAAAESLWPRLVNPGLQRLQDTVAPALFGGFAFAPRAADGEEWAGFDDGCFILPRWSYNTDGRRASLSLALTGPDDFDAAESFAKEFRAIAHALEAPARDSAEERRRLRLIDDPRRGDWIQRVTAARDRIRAGQFQKVVLARRTAVAADRPFDSAAILARSQGLHPGACRFAFRPADDSVFLGATPELLVLKRGLAATTEALAGTAPRPSDETQTQEAIRRLTASAKDLAEHAQVVAGIRDALAPHCVRVTAADRPGVRVLTHLLHLATPVTAELCASTALPNLIDALHPTPATGGRPREPALAWIDANEPHRRGWYAGPIGRLGSDGDGEFRVAIRSALVRGARAWIFAGAGIVADSDPELEFKEIILKESSVLAMLGDVA